MKILYQLLIVAFLLPVAAAAQNTIPGNNQRGENKTHTFNAISLPKDTVDKNGVKTAKQIKKEEAAVKKAAEKKQEDPVQTELISADRNALFTDKAKFTFTVKNNTPNALEGKVSYQVTTMTGEKLNKDSVLVKIGVKDKKGYEFEIPEAKAGFYKVNFMINVTDYDDTTRRVFGIRPQEITSIHKKPADFDEFWKTTRAELSRIAPKFKTTLVKDSLGRHIYAIEMKSLDNLTVRGWMTVPINPHHRYPVWLGLPGYQVNLKPIVTDDDELAIITLNVRGQGNSRDVIATPKDEYICYHIEDKNRYVMRGAIMDCIRCIDYIFSRKELDKNRIFVTGGSMGGFLAVATAALDDRVTICSAQNPIFCDVRQLVGEVEWPMSDLIKYTRTRPGLTVDKMLDNLDYFDIKNFAPGVNCPMLMAVGLLDPLAPPNNEYAAYNLLQSDKKILVYKDKAHEVGETFGTIQGKWMQEAFALF